jgi:hypothetical protein
LYFFVFSGPKKPAGSPTGRQTASLEESAKLAEEVSINVAREAPGEAVAFIIAQAEAAWNKDPFIGKALLELDKKRLDKDLAGPRAPVREFVYSGYLTMMGKELCIIDGMEYEAGERLLPGKQKAKAGKEAPEVYVVRDIYPNRVIIEAQSDGRQIVVPLRE